MKYGGSRRTRLSGRCPQLLLADLGELRRHTAIKTSVLRIRSRYPWDRTFKDTVSFDELQELARQSMEVPEESESENKNWLEKLKRADPKPNYLANSMNHTTSYNVGLEGSKRVNPPELLDERRDEKPENGKVKKDSSLFDDTFFQPLKRKLLSENSQQAVKRVKVSPINSIDDEATQSPLIASACTISSPLHEDSSVTLSANSLVTKPGLETLAKNSD
ncbi:hypothetical protein K469DRAFT_812757 [Zopfia rhizophila CBS 207.26]|uniref:Uncharacterized protein n=1 Tax=Zopfia rhizophila CBS 207.26 TaxID=1314779 RepID=A0A6A6DAR8_9PEZI|nr:hypothetical protein K469DRAFT_812757 [Zopfia rhizophila CBS 207.26]